MRSVPEMVRDAVARNADRPCIFRRGGGQELVPESYAVTGQTIEETACGLLDAGVQPREHVVLVSENRPDWLYADGGILFAGAITVPLYPSLPSEQLVPLIQRVRARVAVVGDRSQLAKIEAAKDELPSLERVYVFDADKVPADHPFARPWSEVVERGRARREELAAELEQRIAALDTGDVATIIFTSGTTGEMKGAQLTHGNLTSNAEAALKRITVLPEDRLLTMLPLSHVFQRIVIFLGLKAGAATLFNESLRTVMSDLQALRPTVLVVVPRVLEMIRTRVESAIAQKEGVAGKVARWGMGVADQVSAAYVAQKPPGAWLEAQYKLADQRVLRAIRQQLGLDEIRFAVSGGAALPPELGRWCYGLGVPVIQGYGLTETSPVIAVADPHAYLRFDSIGPPVEGVEVKIADDGEILTRGPHVMKGYFEMPAETAEVIDAEGWFHTGDLGEWLPGGGLRITDRKKNILVLANGKNVAPLAIETRLAESPLIDRAMLVGDQQNVITALVVPAYDALRDELRRRGETVPDGDDRSWVRSPAAEKAVQAEIERLSSGLAAFERVRKFRLLERDFTLEHGEVTPTLKLRRKVILEHFRDDVQAMAE